jgi:hypothetical protein
MQRYVINFSMTYGRWFSWGTPISTINKTDFHDITELLLKVVVKHHNPNPKYVSVNMLKK